MKLKLLYLMMIGCFSCNVMKSSSEPSLNKATPAEIHVVLVGQLCNVRNEAKTKHDRARTCEYFSIINSDLNEIASKIEANTETFLMLSHNAQGLIKIKSDDFCCYHLPHCFCWIPLSCIYACRGAHTARYDRAQFNAIKAAALAEQNMKR